MPRPSHHRAGFTLIELLVVLTIVLILASLLVAFSPRVTERQKTARGADQLQQWLVIARQWARKDRMPTGLRLSPGTLYPNVAAPNSAYVSDMQYIQQPDDYHPVNSQTGASGVVPQTVLLPPAPRGTPQTTAGQFAFGIKLTDKNTGASIDMYGGQGPGTVGAFNYAVWLVQPGDYLEMSGQVFQIQDVIPDPGPTGVPQTPTIGDTIVIYVQSSTFPVPTTSDYKVYRGPRPLPGESVLQLPKDVAVDATTNATFGNPLPTNPFTGNVDILFAPDGSVIGQGTIGDKLILWVRDVTQDPTADPANMLGDQSLITVYTRTGFVAAHPVFGDIRTLSNTPVQAGRSKTITVQNSANINPGSYVILDWQNTNRETCLVTQVLNQTTIVLQQVINVHPAPGQQGYAVIGDPYTFTRDGRSSGL